VINAWIGLRSAKTTTIAVVSKARSKPAFMVPMAAQLVAKLPEGPEWLYELKFDGYRALIIKDGPEVRIISRNQKDLTRTYPTVTAAAGKLAARQAVIDGEIVAHDLDGQPSFQALQHTTGPRTIVFYAFDLLHLNGLDMTHQPLENRRAKLPMAVGNSGLVVSEELPGTAAAVIKAVKKLRLEGVIAKRRDSVYEAGERSGGWRKIKLDLQQEFVIGGFRPNGQTVEALLVGYYEGRSLRFGAKVRAGFVPRLRRDLFAKLEPLVAATCPFADLPTGTSRWGGGVTAEEMRELRWVKPQLVAQIRFVEWTADGHLRHAVFLGLRTDKDPKDVRREMP
jgi:bifunctional non-homologous end joining protein LigD